MLLVKRLTIVIALCGLFIKGAAQSDLPDLETTPFDTLTNQIYSGNTDQKAKRAVGKIMRYIGLPQNFIVISEGVNTAIAYVKNKDRYIAYNEDFIKRISDSTNTDWAAISILAHEIAHHLAGHTLNIKNSSPGNELEADVFSGFILYRMGAQLDEALAAMREFKPVSVDKKYPPKDARLSAIKSGWKEAQLLANTSAVATNDSLSKENKSASLLYEIVFNGDKNVYFVDDANRVIWFDNYGTPIVIGTMSTSENKNYKWVYSYLRTDYGVDSKGRIWMMTDHGAMINSGQVYKYTKY